MRWFSAPITGRRTAFEALTRSDAAIGALLDAPVGSDSNRL
jgi:hypothetical protein